MTSFKLTLSLGSLLNLCVFLNSWFIPDIPTLLRVCNDLSVIQRGESHLAPRFGLTRNHTLRQQFLKYVNIQIWSINHNPCWSPDQEIWKCPLGDSCNNWGSRRVYKLLPRKSHQPLARPRESAMMMYPCLYPWKLSLPSRCVGYLKPVPQAEAPS